MTPTDPSQSRVPEMWDWPADWTRADLPMAQKAFKITDAIIAVLILWPDGANGIVLAYPGGIRFARLAPETSFALEERYEGDPPTFADDRDVAKGWKFLLDTMIDAGKRADAELGGRP